MDTSSLHSSSFICQVNYIKQEAPGVDFRGLAIIVLYEFRGF
jgi:hypothetical protein